MEQLLHIVDKEDLLRQLPLHKHVELDVPRELLAQIL